MIDTVGLAVMRSLSFPALRVHPSNQPPTTQLSSSSLQRQRQRKGKDKGEGKDKDIHKYNKIVDKCVRPSNQPPTTQLSSSSFHLEGAKTMVPGHQSFDAPKVEK